MTTRFVVWSGTKGHYSYRRNKKPTRVKGKEKTKKTGKEPEWGSQCKPRPKGEWNNRDLEKHTIPLPYNKMTKRGEL
jgi:hypothetical protein